jgi:hypothetical protein
LHFLLSLSFSSHFLFLYTFLLLLFWFNTLIFSLAIFWFKSSLGKASGLKGKIKFILYSNFCTVLWITLWIMWIRDESATRGRGFLRSIAHWAFVFQTGGVIIVTVTLPVLVSTATTTTTTTTYSYGSSTKTILCMALGDLLTRLLVVHFYH